MGGYVKFYFDGSYIIAMRYEDRRQRLQCIRGLQVAFEEVSKEWAAAGRTIDKNTTYIQIIPDERTSQTATEDIVSTPNAI